jgi:AraC-like DNA-binding protein
VVSNSASYAAYGVGYLQTVSELHQTWVLGTPAGRLQPFVERYVGYRMLGYPPGVHRGLPSRHMTFIASIGEPIHVVAQTAPSQLPRTYATVLSGLQASTALIEHNGNQEGVAIELTPLGSRTLFGMPARELWDLTLELNEVVGGEGAELWERLQAPSAWTDRFAACDEVLLRLAGDNSVAPELQHSWEALVASGGQLSVNQLASEMGYSRQHLGRRFNEEFGLSPKLAARIMRFERARRMLRAKASTTAMADVAAACGYYDQSHLHHDFADLAGCTPREWLGEDLPNFQDDVTTGDS